jgi:hypothetical protein
MIVSSSTITAVPLCGTAARQTTINGSNYCVIDVSGDIIVNNPGYSYFINGSVTFLGVKFQTICSSNYQGCPNSTGSSTQMMIGAIKLNMTFPDQTVETAGQAIGTSEHILILSNHFAPRGGLQYDYGPSPHFRVLLLVQLQVTGA